MMQSTKTNTPSVYVVIGSITVLAAFLLIGCATLVRDGSETAPRPPKILYPALHYDLESIHFAYSDIGKEEPFSAVFIITMCCLDIPLSLITDTLFLYHDIKEIRSTRRIGEGQPTIKDIKNELDPLQEDTARKLVDPHR